MSQNPSDGAWNFYQTRKFIPAWAGENANGAITELRAAFAHAREQGLYEDDYTLPAQDNSPPSIARTARFDLAITEAALKYVQDVKTGKIRPSEVYEDVELPPPAFDSAHALNQALEEHTLEKFLAELPPSHPEYQRLVNALGRYRAIADKGGWPSVPVANQIRLDPKDRGYAPLIKRLAAEDAVLAKIARPSVAQVRDAVKRFQARNGFPANGTVSKMTISALNVSANFRAAQIAANMERWRWMPLQFEQRYVAVNVAGQSLEFVRDGKAALTSKVVVGRKSSTTPIVRATVEAIVLNPPWNIPGDIAARDLLPRLKKNAGYLATRNMVVTDGPANDPYGKTIDWKKVEAEKFPYAIRQLPGPATALGALMLDSPNDFDVYLHDTPNKKLFDLSDREISNGCVRVQQIFPLASLALTGDTAKGMTKLNATVKTRRTTRMPLDAPLPVYFLYWTAIADPDGTVEFRPDRYGRDAPLILAMTKADRDEVMRENSKQQEMADEPMPSEADELSP